MDNKPQDDNDIYSFSNFPLKRIIFASFILIFLGFFLNFPITEVIVKNVENTLSSMRKCPIKYDKVEVEYLFLPKVKLVNPTIPGVCFGNPSSSISLKELAIKLWLPGFLPPGLRVYIPIEYGKTEGNIYVTLGLGKVHINVKDSNINGDILNQLSTIVKKINGDIKVNVLADMDKTGPLNADVLIKSTNFKIGSQNIMGFNIKNDIQIGTIQIKGEYKKPKLNILEFNIGKANSPIKTKLKGSVRLDKRYPKASKLDLKGTIFFSQNFISDFPVLNLLLAGKKANSAGAYNIVLKGTLGAPIPTFQ